MSIFSNIKVATGRQESAISFLSVQNKSGDTHVLIRRLLSRRHSRNLHQNYFSTEKCSKVTFDTRLLTRILGSEAVGCGVRLAHFSPTPRHFACERNMAAAFDYELPSLN